MVAKFSERISEDCFQPIRKENPAFCRLAYWLLSSSSIENRRVREREIGALFWEDWGIDGYIKAVRKSCWWWRIDPYIGAGAELRKVIGQRRLVFPLRSLDSLQLWRWEWKWDWIWSASPVFSTYASEHAWLVSLSRIVQTATTTAAPDVNIFFARTQLIRLSYSCFLPSDWAMYNRSQWCASCWLYQPGWIHVGCPPCKLQSPLTFFFLCYFIVSFTLLFLGSRCLPYIDLH